MRVLILCAALICTACDASPETRSLAGTTSDTGLSPDSATIGPQGPTGAQGAIGPTGPQGALGQAAQVAHMRDANGVSIPGVFLGFNLLPSSVTLYEAGEDTTAVYTQGSITKVVLYYFGLNCSGGAWTQMSVNGLVIQNHGNLWKVANTIAPLNSSASYRDVSDNCINAAALPPFYNVVPYSGEYAKTYTAPFGVVMQ